MKLSIAFLAILIAITGLAYLAKTNAQVIKSTPDMGVIKLLDQKYDAFKWVLIHDRTDSTAMYAYYFNHGYVIYIQVIGFAPDTTVFVKYNGRAVCTYPATDELIKKKLLP